MKASYNNSLRQLGVAACRAAAGSCCSSWDTSRLFALLSLLFHLLNFSFLKHFTTQISRISSCSGVTFSPSLKRFLTVKPSLAQALGSTTDISSSLYCPAQSASLLSPFTVGHWLSVSIFRFPLPFPSPIPTDTFPVRQRSSTHFRVTEWFHNIVRPTSLSS